MQKNIFEPSGKIGQKDFITNYILLLMTYILGGTLIFFLVNKYHLGITYIVLPLLLIKTLIAFNYKKRILDITDKTYTLQLVGDDKQIRALGEMLRPIGVKEFIRSGKVALSRGNQFANINLE